MTDLEARARLFALAAHSAVDQRRKYTNEPYIVHLAAVASLVKSVASSSEMVAAAWLHDVVEDTKITLEIIADEFGREVGNYVYWLTDFSKPEDGNREIRKQIDREHIALAPFPAQTIKVADLIDNTRTIVARDPNFARTYLREKRQVLTVLKRADPVLLNIAIRQIEEAVSA